MPITRIAERLDDSSTQTQFVSAPVEASGSVAALIGRILIALLFFISGAAKLLNTEETVTHMTARGIPEAEILGLAAGVAELAGAAAIALGFLTRAGAVGLILFLIPTTVLFHDFWSSPAAEQQTQMIMFLKNLAIIGGLSLLVSRGAGRFSIDALFRPRTIVRPGDEVLRVGERTQPPAGIR